jgi:hypothetical protein
VCLVLALALTAVATISLPLVPNVDIVRVQWDLSNSTDITALNVT